MAAPTFPQDRYGMPGFPRLISRGRSLSDKQDDIRETALSLVNELRRLRHDRLLMR